MKHSNSSLKFLPNGLTFLKLAGVAIASKY